MAAPDERRILDLPGGRAVRLYLRRSPRARRMPLRLAPAGEAVELVLPRGISAAQGLRFAEDNRSWLATRLEDLPPRVPFTDGICLPVLGVERRIRHRPDQLRLIEADDSEIRVGGAVEKMPARIETWLRETAREAFRDRTAAMAAELGRPAPAVTIRDTRSRWGSCSPRGGLAFSWRLVLAPVFVTDYVAAHETAHLVEMNHGPAFWRVVDRLNGRAKEARRWLRSEGAALHRYG
ncbi:MAG: M48 family metallopeptidase [Rhodospirillaceae bacterium]|nr:M48 family metallopeptidase [Rhodospirillaceae bacterium]